ncbi:MAG: DNA double-strand break repair nuclease NurA [Candidatus Altiarchaeota archaeon]
MRHYDLWLDRYAMRRTQILTTWSGLAKTVCELRSRIPDDRLFTELKDAGEVGYRMGFVDGGEGLKELLGLGVYFIRASGLLMSKEGDGELFIRDLDINVIDYDDHTKERVELLREGMEFDVALRCVKEHKPQMLFLDGSLYVKARRKPVECVEYDLYRKKYGRLLRSCKKERVRLIGVSEDTRSRLLSSHLGKEYGIKLPRYMTDSTILRILSKGGPYRSVEFVPRQRLETEGRIEDGIVSEFKTAYLQPTELANPLRVDAPDWEDDFSEAISVISSLCKGSGQYGYPLPLYIAHMDARIPESQMEWTARQIVNYVSKRDSVLGSAVLKATRRGMRPK